MCEMCPEVEASNNLARDAAMDMLEQMALQHETGDQPVDEVEFSQWLESLLGKRQLALMLAVCVLQIRRDRPVDLDREATELADQADMLDSETGPDDPFMSLFQLVTGATGPGDAFLRYVAEGHAS